MKEFTNEKKVGMLFIIFSIIGFGILGFAIWVIIKLLQYFGVV